jgi:hypothetical protein
MRRFAKTGLILGALVVTVFAAGWLYDNTLLGCYVEKADEPPLKPGTPEYAAMERAALYLPKKPLGVNDLKEVRTYVERLWPGEGQTFTLSPYSDEEGREEVLNRRDYWFITFHPIHERTLFGCNYMHLDGVWTAIVRKHDLMVMNQRDYQ